MQKTYFNLSHTKGAVACIVADSEVGIDIEGSDNVGDMLAKKILTAREMKDILEENALTLTEYFVLKESYMKYTGRGLGIGFNAVELYKTDSKIQSNKNAFFSLYSLDNGRYTMACCMNEDINCDVREYSVEELCREHL